VVTADTGCHGSPSTSPAAAGDDARPIAHGEHAIDRLGDRRLGDRSIDARS
jgi:hypothetical protein